MKTSLVVNQSMEGETIEAKVRRIVEQKEAISDGAPQIFTDRADGVLPETNIRTDRWELATEMTDIVTKQKIANREGAPTATKGQEAPEAKQKTKKKSPKAQSGGTQSDGAPTDTGPSGE